MTGLQMKAAAEAASGRRLTLKGVPWTLLRAAGLFSPMMREIVKMSYLWRTPHSLDGSKLERTVGTTAGDRSGRCAPPGDRRSGAGRRREDGGVDQPELKHRPAARQSCRAPPRSPRSTGLRSCPSTPGSAGSPARRRRRRTGHSPRSANAATPGWRRAGQNQNDDENRRERHGKPRSLKHSMPVNARRALEVPRLPRD